MTFLSPFSSYRKKRGKGREGKKEEDKEEEETEKKKKKMRSTYLPSIKF